MGRKQLNYGLFLLLALIWSASYLGIKESVLYLPPFFSAMIRVLIAQMVLSTVFVCTRQNLAVSLSQAWRLWVTGIFAQGIPFALLFWGEQTVAPALAGIINSTVVAWALILNILIFRDLSQATVWKITGLVLGILGALIIFWPIINHSHSELLGVLAVLGMAISYAFGALLNQHFIAKRMQISLQANLWQQHWGSLVFLLVLTTVAGNMGAWPILFQHPHALGALIYLGVCSTAIAWGIYTYLIREWGAVRTSTTMLLVPGFAILWDAVFMHDRPTGIEMLGLLLILLGVSLIQFTKKRRGC